MSIDSLACNCPPTKTGFRVKHEDGCPVVKQESSSVETPAEAPTSKQRLMPPGEPHRKADDWDVWILPGRGEYSVGDAFLHYRLMWEAYVASLAHETAAEPVAPLRDFDRFLDHMHECARLRDADSDSPTYGKCTCGLDELVARLQVKTSGETAAPRPLTDGEIDEQYGKDDYAELAVKTAAEPRA